MMLNETMNYNFLNPFNRKLIDQTWNTIFNPFGASMSTVEVRMMFHSSYVNQPAQKRLEFIAIDIQLIYYNGEYKEAHVKMQTHTHTYMYIYYYLQVPLFSVMFKCFLFVCISSLSGLNNNFVVSNLS